MVHEFEACAECTHRCLLVHGKRRSGSHNDNSFFKIMFGNDFTNFMELPPRVARNMLLSDRRTFLEDFRGERWNVVISTVNGSKAFHKGWNAFALDHDLQVGDILMFHYVPGSHFVVKVYDASGCELNFFKTIHQQNRNSYHTDDQCHTIVKSTASKSGLDTLPGPNAGKIICLNELNEMIKPLLITENASTHDDDNGRSNAKRKAEFPEDLSCMIERNYGNHGNQPEEDRAHILDLSSVELFKKMRICAGEGATRVSVANETHPYRDESSLKLRSQASSVKILMADEVVDRVIPWDASEVERTGKNDSSESKVKETSLSDKSSSTNVNSGHPFPLLPENSQQNGTFSGSSIRAAQKSQSANASGNGNHVAVQENDFMDDTDQSANKKDIGIPKSRQVANSSAIQNDTVIKITETEVVELTSHPCRKEVIPENDVTMITEKETGEFTSERKDVATTAMVILDLTKDKCSKEANENAQLNSGKSPDVSIKVDNQISSSNPRDITSRRAEFERTEEHKKSGSKISKVECDKNSCSATSGRPFTARTENPKEIIMTITDTSEATFNISKNKRKECQNADGRGNGHVKVSQKKPSLMDDRDNTGLTGVSGSICCPINFEHQNLDDKIINEKKSLKATPQRKAQSAQSEKMSTMFQNRSSFARKSGTTLALAKPEPVEDDVPLSTIPTFTGSYLGTNRQSTNSHSSCARERGTTLALVKPEPVDDAVVPNFTISCLAANRQSYLELPKSLPLSMKPMNGRLKMDRRLVYLRGPDNRLWPVLYIQKFYYRTLASGWEVFSMANNVEEGDRCTIMVADPTKGICDVEVVKMRDDMEFYEECERQPLINL